jgi:chemotaxis protein methyltransferase CheR
MDVKILATDIAPSVLKTGMRGEYSAEKIQTVPRHILAKYFKKKNHDGDWVHTVNERIRNMVLFRQFNLNVSPYPLRGPLDFIFCRNVMIYFDRAVRTRIVSEFRRLLGPGGHLFLGHSESLNGISEGFKSVKPSIYVRV